MIFKAVRTSRYDTRSKVVLLDVSGTSLPSNMLFARKAARVFIKGKSSMLPKNRDQSSVRSLESDSAGGGSKHTSQPPVQRRSRASVLTIGLDEFEVTIVQQADRATDHQSE